MKKRVLISSPKLPLFGENVFWGTLGGYFSTFEVSSRGLSTSKVRDVKHCMLRIIGILNTTSEKNGVITENMSVIVVRK